MNLQYSNKNPNEIFEELKTSALGLSEKEAATRLKLYGANEVIIQRINIWNLLVRQLRSPFFYLLFFAGAISFLVGEVVDGLVILCFVGINLVLGFLQESRAEKAVSLIEKYVPAESKVLRSGKLVLLNKKLLAPGDIVFLEMGDVVPADLRLIKTESLSLDESSLSGESTSVEKNEKETKKEATEIFEAKNMAFAGTTVVLGSGKGIVIATGKNTYFGNITEITKEISRESAYEKNLLRFSKIIMQLVVATIILVYVLNFFIKGAENLVNFSIFCIALVVSILPEALPVIATFALSKGAMTLAEKHVVVKRLSSVEDLGNIEILCTDKTGTLTENKLALKNNIAYDQEKNLYFGMLASAFTKGKSGSNLNPFDKAFFEESNEEQRKHLRNHRHLAEIPFDHFRLRGLVLAENEIGERFLIMRGAPEIVSQFCSRINGKISQKKIEEQFRQEAQKGRRVLSIAYKKVSRNKSSLSEKDEKGLTFLGMFSFEDPLKPSALDTVMKAKKLGVVIKILTGDCREAAGEIAKQARLISNLKEVITGTELARLKEKDFCAACKKYAVFARISPDMKLRIIKTLQQEQEVGFLGEGVNDAPALKLANVGIAVKEAVDISRSVADIVLLRKDLRVVVNGVQEGRNIFANINKYIKCTLAANFGNFYSIAIISLFVDFVPMWPVQILLVNLLSDFPLIAVATDSVDSSELKKPKAYGLEQILGLIIMLAIVNSLADLLIFALFRNSGISLLQTVWFAEGILTEIALIYVVRTKYFFWKAKKPARPLVLLSILIFLVTLILPYTFLGQNYFHLTAMNGGTLIAVLLLVGGYFVVSEGIKTVYFRYRKQ